MTAAGMSICVQLVLCSMLVLLSCARAQPRVEEYFPEFGPLAGETRIFLTGVNLTNIHEVWLQFETDDIKLNINFTGSTSAVIDCVTPAVSHDFLSQMGTYLLIFNQSDGLYNYSATQGFTYRPDPVVTAVMPLKSIIRGGIEQTIIGRNFDSVIYARLTMTILHQNQHKYDQTDFHSERNDGLCRLQNSTMIYCNSKPISNSPIDPIPGWNPLYRPEYQIWLGYQLDGVKTWNFTQIQVWQNPGLMFDDDITAFQVYKGQTEIEIRGSNINTGAAQKDYRILIGNGTTASGGQSICNITYFITNLIRCEPPMDKPIVGTIHKGGQPRVTVDVGYLHDQLGYLRYELKPLDDSQVRTTVISVVCVVVIILLIIPIVVMCARKRRQEEQALLTDSNGYTRAPGLWDRVPPDLKQKLQPCMKDQERLKLGRALGEGNFGSVHAGKFVEEDGKTLLVAAKTIKESEVTPQQLREFLEEATMMRDFNHPHVLHLVGVVFKAGRPYVLLPFMENGDLKSYILNVNNVFTVENLIQYSLQIAQGMNYIGNKNFVHRDLAARNCMINIDNVVKVADFGLARDVYGDDYYRVGDAARPLPIKWMAPECLDDRIFTKYSDIWSYGITIWEILTRGKRPYQDVDNFSLKEFLSTGRRLDKPEASPGVIYELMLKCWSAEPKRRPTFEKISEELEFILNSPDDTEDNIVAGRATNDLQTQPYQNLSRYVDHNTDRHKYQSLVVAPETPQRDNYADMSGTSGAMGINYKDAQSAFDSIPDEDEDDYIGPDRRDNDGYLPPFAMQQKSENGHLSPNSLPEGAARGINNPTYVNTETMSAVADDNRSNLTGQRDQNRNDKQPIRTGDIELTSMS